MSMSKELHRLATYSSWPVKSGISPLALAKCGFFYNGKNDEVECFQCKTRVSSWTDDDNPHQKHRQMAPHCQLLTGNCTDHLPANISLPVPNRAAFATKRQTEAGGANNLNDELQPHDETSEMSSILCQALSRAERNGVFSDTNGCTITSSNVNEVDRSGQSTVQQHPTRIDSSPISRPLIPERAAPVDRAPEQLTLSAGDPPKYPAFKEYSARVESFRKGIVGEGQTAEGLADAGWFHVGPNDKVRCFQCGGNLRDWEQGDDPWVEHKRWYDYCQYTKTHRPTPRPRAPEGPAILTIPSNIGSFRIEPREVKARMDTPTVRAILDMGYSRDKVKAVIEIRLSTTGDDFPNAESLLEALFRLEETTTSTSAGATASSFASEDGNHSVYSNISTVASTAFRSSGKQKLRNDLQNGISLNNNVPAIDRAHPDFDVLQSEAERRSTFYDWPSYAKADPMALAQAGFSYTGTGDHVQCFTCKGVVGNWEPSAVPSSEHKKHFPSCSFAHGLEILNNFNHDHVVRYEFTTDEIGMRMDTPTVYLVLDMGFPYGDVKKVIKRKLLETGDDFQNVKSLLLALFELEDSSLASEIIVNTSSEDNAIND